MQKSLKADIIHQIPEQHINFDEFSAVTYPYGLVKFSVNENNLYAQQNDREFQTYENKVRSFLGIKYIKSIEKIPTIKSFWK